MQIKNKFSVNLKKEIISEIKFDHKRPSWISRKEWPKYIGLYFDNRLDFKFHLEKTIIKVDQNMWRLKNHCNSSCSATLLNIFYCWIFPHFLYGAPLWIFQVFDNNISCLQSPVYGYGRLYNKLNSLYIKCAKLIMGLNSDTSSFAVLVRIGWLPINYVLSIQAICWVFRLKKIPRSEISQLFFSLKDIPVNDEKWGNTLYFKPAYDLMLRFEKIYNQDGDGDTCNFLDVQNINIFKNRLRKAAFLDFNNFWDNCSDGIHTKKYFPSFCKIKLYRNFFNRCSETFYYRLSFTQNNLNVFSHHIGRTDSDVCRFCNVFSESVDHILGNCDKLDYNNLKFVCTRHNLDFSVLNLLSHEKLKYHVEKFLYCNFDCMKKKKPKKN